MSRAFKRRAFGKDGFTTDNRNTFGRVRVPKRRPSDQPQREPVPESEASAPQVRESGVLAICLGVDRARTIEKQPDVQRVLALDSPADIRVSLAREWQGQVRIYAEPGDEWNQAREHILKPLSRQRGGGKRVTMAPFPGNRSRAAS